MSGKAEERRVRQSLDRQRLKLKEEQIQLIQERRELRRERTDALVWLRMLTERYGNSSWTDETPLAMVLEQHLNDPLTATLDSLMRRYHKLQSDLAQALSELQQRPQAADQAPQAAPIATPSRPPQPLRPSAVPEQQHRSMVVRSQLRGDPGFRATCICGWRSAQETTEQMAIVSGDRHAGLFEPRRAEQGRR